jgi:hypothetical protein
MKTLRNQIIGTLALVGLSACQPSKTVHIYDHSPTTASAQSGPQGEPKSGILQGTINGGGGKGVLCERDGKSTLEVLDLYEGRVLYQRKPKEINVSNEAEMIAAASKLVAGHFLGQSGEQNKEVSDYFNREIIVPLVKSIRYIDGQLQVKETNDSKEPLTERGCKVVQIAVYHNESVLLINQDFWQKLDWRNRTALILHELVYRYGRGVLNESDSTNTRKLVAFLMSKEGAVNSWGRYANQGYDADYTVCNLKDKNGLDQGNIAFNPMPEKKGQIGTEVVFRSVGQLKTGFLATYGEIDYANVFQDLAQGRGFSGSFNIRADGFDHIGVGYAEISLQPANPPSACGESGKWAQASCLNRTMGPDSHHIYVGELRLDGPRGQTFALNCEDFRRLYSCQTKGRLGKEFENLELEISPAAVVILKKSLDHEGQTIIADAGRVTHPQKGDGGLYFGSGNLVIDGLVVGKEIEIEVPLNTETGGLRTIKTTIRYQSEKGTVEAKDIQCQAI